MMMYNTVCGYQISICLFVVSGNLIYVQMLKMLFNTKQNNPKAIPTQKSRHLIYSFKLARLIISLTLANEFFK